MNIFVVKNYCVSKSNMDRNISNELIEWYLLHKRALPWRDTSDPYYIWVSEIILQQTRVQQGLPYYLRFIEEFSNINFLAEAPLERILKLWQGLGYYSRARNMHIAAKQIVENYNGQFPASYKELLLLKGVGEYTAAAVASLAYNEPVAVVDGNVVRVISRLFAIQNPVDKPSVIKEIKELANNLLAFNRPAMHNQAIMEFGALHCVPVKPDCFSCPVNGKCLAFKFKLVESIPYKKSKISIKTRFFNYLVIHENEGIFFQKRSTNDIWEGLYEFPLIVTEEQINPENIPGMMISNGFEGIPFETIGFMGPVKHILTHQHLQVNFIHVKLGNLSTNLKSKWVWKELDKIQELAVPRVIDKYMQSPVFRNITGCNC